MNSPHVNITRDLLRLAEAASASFPLLQMVRFRGIAEDMLATLQPAFTASKVLCLTDDLFHGERDPGARRWHAPKSGGERLLHLLLAFIRV